VMEPQEVVHPAQPVMASDDVAARTLHPRWR
jgi:hypothetical protein